MIALSISKPIINFFDQTAILGTLDASHTHHLKMSLDEASVADDYFNDLSRQPNIGSGSLDIQSNSNQSEDTTGTSKPKRIACVVCRKRKLKCDGGKPSCASCSRLGHCCAYDEIRRKSGPKRGYVKELEARLGVSLLFGVSS